MTSPSALITTPLPPETWTTAGRTLATSALTRSFKSFNSARLAGLGTSAAACCSRGRLGIESVAARQCRQSDQRQGEDRQQQGPFRWLGHGICLLKCEVRLFWQG